MLTETLFVELVETTGAGIMCRFILPTEFQTQTGSTGWLVIRHGPPTWES